MNNAEKLIKSIKGQAELFLIDSGEFAPFATSIYENGELKFISGFSENTDSKEIYDILLQGAYEDLKNPEVRIYAIGLDGQIQGRDVLVIEMILSSQDKYQAIYPYDIKDGKVYFGDKLN